MKLSFYHYLMISSLSLLLGCASSDVEDEQSQIEKTEVPASMSGRKAYIDPATGELTSTPPASERAQRSSPPVDDEPVIFDTVVNDHGVQMLVPRNPIHHELRAKIDCNGNLQTGHDITDQPDNCSKKEMNKEAE